MMKRERGNRRPRRKVCSFCVDKVQEIDYKDAAKLRKFITELLRQGISPDDIKRMSQQTPKYLMHQ